MSQYSSQRVREIVGLSQSALKGLIAAGFVTPARGARREYRFTFQDLVVLRMAKSLAEAKLAPRRISASLRKLRKQLPDTVPITGLKVRAVGNDVVVAEGPAQWRIDDGQYLLAFEVSRFDSDVRFVETPFRPLPPEQWFEHGLSLEESDAVSAIASYEKAVEDDACKSGAYVNWGRLLHQAGRLTDAAAVYERGIRSCGGDAVLLFNFAVLREDQKRHDDAIALYEQSLALDPESEDAHYNLALLYQSLGRKRDAVRHLSAYRKLTTRGKSPGRGE